MWVVLILVLRPVLDPEVMHAGALAATMPIWFLAVYLSLTALALHPRLVAPSASQGGPHSPLGIGHQAPRRLHRG